MVDTLEVRAVGAAASVPPSAGCVPVRPAGYDHATAMGLAATAFRLTVPTSKRRTPVEE
jgi:hypothetical protein